MQKRIPGRSHRKRGFKGAKTKLVPILYQICNASNSATAASTCQELHYAIRGALHRTLGGAIQHSTTMQEPKPAPLHLRCGGAVGHSHHSTWKTTRVKHIPKQYCPQHASQFVSTAGKRKTINTLPSHGEVQNHEHIALPQGWGPTIEVQCEAAGMTPT